MPRQNICCPQDWHEAWKQQAILDECESLSDWIIQCCEANLSDRARRKLSTYTPRMPRPPFRITINRVTPAGADIVSAWEAAAAAAELSLEEWITEQCNLAAGTEIERSPAATPQRSDSHPTYRFNVSAPADHLAAWKARAARDKQNLSEWVSNCCNANLPQRIRRQLSKRNTAGRPVE